MSGSPVNDSAPAPRAPSTESSRRRIVAVALGLLGVPLVLVAAALRSAERAPTAPAARVNAAAPRSAGPSSAMSIDLHRVICGDCCVGNLWKAIGTMPGVRDIDAKAGNQKFVVYYDPAAVRPERVLTTLIASGEAAASLVPVDPSAPAPGTERRWVRPVRR